MAQAASAPQPTAPRTPAAREARRAPPSKRLLAVAAIVTVVEVVILGVLLARFIHTKYMRDKADRLTHLQLKADEIRQAWPELVEQGAMLRARLAQLIRSTDELKRHILAEAKLARVTVEIRGPERVKRMSNAQRLIITGVGPEKSILQLLVLLDRLPAITSIENLQLTGASKGTVSLNLNLVHHGLNIFMSRKLKAFVKEIPSIEAYRKTEINLPRPGGLFLASLPPDEEVLAGWPRIMLGGFTSDKALFIVDGDPRSAGIGETVTPEIVYADKPSVNQALLKRKADGAEVILTIGSATYGLKPSRARGMSEFMLTIQKRPVSDIIAAASQ